MPSIFFKCSKCGADIETDESGGGGVLECPNCGATIEIPTPRILPGLEIGGFVIESLLGVGGMGQVWLAHQISMNRKVALKILSPELTRDPEAVERFMKEVRTTANLTHPNIITAYDAGVDKGIYFLAVAYVDGVVLQKILEKDNFPERDALLIARDIAKGLLYAWEKFKLIHRDIKPENIMIGRDGVPKLMDMGISKTMFDNKTLTMTGTIIGSPHYMSPEQAKAGKDIDFRTDIYSLGATLYHMVTGHLPFDGDSSFNVILKVISEAPVPPKQINTFLSDDFSRLIEIMMSKKRGDRQQSWELLLKDIDNVIAGKKLVGKNHSINVPYIARNDPPPRQVRRPMLKILLTASVLLNLILFAYFLAREFLDKSMDDAGSGSRNSLFSVIESRITDKGGGSVDSGKKLIIVEAKYGTGDKWNNITKATRNAVKDNRLIISENDLDFGDPSIGKAKKVVLRYKYGDGEEQIVEGTGAGRAIVVTSKRKHNSQDFTIIEALYGAGITWLNITDKITSRVSQGRLNLTGYGDGRNLCGRDPANFIYKSIVIRYAYRGEEFCKVFSDGGNIILPAEDIVAKEVVNVGLAKEPIPGPSSINTGSVIQLINLEPEIARVGWASLVNGKDIKGDSDPNVGCRPTINNQLVKEDFIFVPSSSHVRYAVPSGVRYFSATLGTRNGKPDVMFKIIVDRKVIFESKMRDWEKNVLDVAVELPPSPKKIDLIIEQPGGGNANPTFWAFPKFLKSKPDKLNAPPNIGSNPPPVKHKAMESDGRSVPLINLKPEMAKVGWASLIIGKDIKKDKDPNANCRPFIDNDFVTEDFLYAPCTSRLQYDIPDGMRFFTATLGSKRDGATFKVLADGKELFNSNSNAWENTFLDIVVELPANSKKLGLLIDNTAGGNAKGTLWIFPRFLTGKPKMDALQLNIPGQQPLIGKWLWGAGNTMAEFKADGTSVNGGNTGTWEDKDGKITIKWSNGAVDTMIITAGNRAEIVNTMGTRFNASKVK